MRSFFYKLDKLISSSWDCSDTSLSHQLGELKEIIKEGNFTTYKKAKLLLSYWGETDKYTSKMTGLSESTVRVVRRNMSNTLYEKLGHDFFDVVNTHNKNAVKECAFRVRLLENKMDARYYIPRDILDIINSNKVIENDNISVTDCGKEIQFLLSHSKLAIEREISTLDINKLSYIIGMLDNEKDIHENRIRLMEVFNK